MRVLVAQERRTGETRVAATPETVKKMVKEGLTVAIEEGAGHAAHFADAAYREAGAEIVPPFAGASLANPSLANPSLANSGPANPAPRAATGAGGGDWSTADAVLTVNAPAAEAVRSMREGALLVGLLAPHHNLEMVRALTERRVTALAMELVPRISRAQSMDALSSQASIAGYKAVLLAAWRLPRYFPLLMTAAGTVPPAKVVVMGAGVAGLQALATAKRLGAQVEVSDIRPAVEEQVKSLGGKFIELPLEESGEGKGGYAKEMGEDFLRRQREIVARHLAAADVVVTTALVPGKPAPRLVTREMVAGMKRGAVIVDLAVEQGGNVELSQADQEVEENGVLILAPSNLAATMAHDASVLYARNVFALLKELVADGELALDLEDEVVAGSLLAHAGEVRHAPTAERLGTGAPAPAAAAEPTEASTETPANREVTVE